MSWGRRVRRDDGVAIVEMALVLPVLVVLLLGMFTGALAWNQSQALGQGARITARYASTLPLPVAGPSEVQATVETEWLKDLITRTVSASEGQLAADVAGRKICVAYVDPAGDDPDETMSVTLTGAGTYSARSSSECFSDGQAATARRIQVLVERSGHIDTGLYRFPLTIRRTAVYRYEADGGL
ncbi:MAG: TadE/TadG family type IV pilus assembly protein [Acidimicrobiia bacterium]|jgi:Flp pilus assembly protein TadG